jgi:hypothetical protein
MAEKSLPVPDHGRRASVLLLLVLGSMMGIFSGYIEGVLSNLAPNG